jgi:paraquat-inducible protein A
MKQTAGKNVEQSGWLLACPHCDTLYWYRKDGTSRTDCLRCGKTLSDCSRSSILRTFCFAFAGWLFLLLANLHPFLTTVLGSQRQTVSLYGCARHLFADGFGVLGVLVGGVLVLFPLLILCNAALVTGALLMGLQLPWHRRLFRTLVTLQEWAMPEIFLLGVFVAYTEIVHYAKIELGVGFYCFISALLMTCVVSRVIDTHLIWSRYERDPVTVE